MGNRSKNNVNCGFYLSVHTFPQLFFLSNRFLLSPLTCYVFSPGVTSLWQPLFGNDASMFFGNFLRWFFAFCLSRLLIALSSTFSAWLLPFSIMLLHARRSCLPTLPLQKYISHDRCDKHLYAPEAILKVVAWVWWIACIFSTALHTRDGNGSSVSNPNRTSISTRI